MALSKTFKRGKYIGLGTMTFIVKPLHTSLISLLVIRLFSIELWGQFAIYLIAIELIVSFLNWGQKPFLLRAFSLSPKKIEEYWSKASIARIPLFIGVGLLFLLVPLFRSYFLPLFIWALFRWLSFLFEPIIQYYRIYWRSISAEVAALITAAACIFIWSRQINLEELLYIHAASSVMRFLILSPLIASNWKSTKLSFQLSKRELMLAFPFFSLALVGLLQTKGELYTAAYLLSNQDFASYQIIIGFLLLGQTLSAMLLDPFQRNIYRLQKNNIQKLKKQYLQAGILLSLLFSTGLLLVLKYIYLIDVNIFYLLLFFAYLFPLYLYFIESQLLLKHKQEKQLLTSVLIAAICNIIMALVLLKFIGIVGALASGILSRLILAKLVISRSKLILKKNDSRKI